jgi:hypothetical protein
MIKSKLKCNEHVWCTKIHRQHSTSEELPTYSCDASLGTKAARCYERSTQAHVVIM